MAGFLHCCTLLQVWMVVLVTGLSLVEPETRCKPKIIRGIDTLTTYLEPDGCGKPAAFAYWLDKPGIFVDKNVIKLKPGQDAGTVYACINSPSLRCAKTSNLSDYCSVFKDEGKILPTLSEISGVTIANLVITTLLDGFFILMAIVFYRRLVGMLTKNAQWKYLSVMQNENKLTECKFCKTDRIVKYIAGTEPLDADLKLERVDEQHKHSTDSITSFPRQTISEQEEPVICSQKKFTKNAPPQIHEKTIPQLEEKDMAKYKPQHLFDKEQDIEKSTAKHSSSTNAETIKELQELRDAALCKICFGEKMSMVFMPCNHIATCVNCSIALQQCPVCRASIQKKMNIRF